MLALRCPRFLTSPSPPPTRGCFLFFAQYTKILQKKPKTSVVEPEQADTPASPLSPQQLERIARNKRAAQERLASGQTPPGFGESWKNGLSAEFGKPYFKQVRILTLHNVLLLFSTVLTTSSLSQLTTFVAEERKRHTVYPPVEHVFTWTQMCDIRDVS